MKTLANSFLSIACCLMLLFQCSTANAQADQKLIDKANAGDIKAMRLLAFCYERGAGVAHDSAMALQWYQRAADKGDGEAWLCISRYYREGRLLPADTARFLAIRKEWADKGLPNGIAALGYAYLLGCGVEADTAKAMKLIEEAARKGSGWALGSIGDNYTYGVFGYPRNNKLAEQYYKKALKAGDLVNYARLAYLYSIMGDTKNTWKYIREAKKWNDPTVRILEAGCYFIGTAEVAADQRKAQQIIADVVSQNNMAFDEAGQMFMDATDPALRDSLKALSYWQKGAAQGDAGCRLSLARYYLNNQQFDKSIRYLKDVINDPAGNEQQGATCASMARICFGGLVKEQGSDSALYWLNMGVDRFKSAECATMLGDFYAEQQNDVTKAIAFYDKAFTLGDTDAIVGIGRMYAIAGQTSEAISTFNRYISYGRPDGYYWLAMTYDNIPDTGKELEALNNGDKAGSALCQQVLGNIYEAGAIGDKPDYKKAEKYYLKSSTSASLDKLGVLYLNGSLGKQSPKDIEKGLAYVQKAADMGNIDAIYRLGYMYETGNVVGEADQEKALSYFKLLADNNIPAGYFKMGLYYELGDGGLEQDMAKAVEYYNRAADMGYGPAMRYLGDFYRIGQYVPLDKKKAFEYYNNAASQGDASAVYYIGRSYLEGCGVDIDTSAAIPYLRSAAMQDVGQAAFLLAEFYNFAKGGFPADGDSAGYYYMMAHNNGSGDASYRIGRQLINENYPKEAVEYLSVGARRGNYDAMVLFAVCLQEGYGIEANPEEAYRIFENVASRVDNSSAYYYMGTARLNGRGCQQSERLGKLYLDTAAALGNTGAMVALAQCYLNGYGCEPDTAAAIQYYRQAIDGGSLAACNRLGYLYEAREEYEKAVACYQQSADGGNYEGMCCLGLCYEKGHGVVLSYRKAYDLYKRAADAGYHRGYLMIAFCYLEGIFVEEDNAKALQWFEKSAEAGNLLAMYNAASMYEEGEDGVKRDLKRAKYWYQKAAAEGYEPAVNALKRMK